MSGNYFPACTQTVTGRRGVRGRWRKKCRQQRNSGFRSQLMHSRWAASSSAGCGQSTTGTVDEKKLRRHAFIPILAIGFLDLMLGNLWSFSSVCVIKAEGHSRGKSAPMLHLIVVQCSVHIARLIISFTWSQVESTLSCPQFIEQSQGMHPGAAKRLQSSQPTLLLGSWHSHPQTPEASIWPRICSSSVSKQHSCSHWSWCWPPAARSLRGDSQHSPKAKLQRALLKGAVTEHTRRTSPRMWGICNSLSPLEQIVHRVDLPLTC